jgi:hypothetical protein
MADPVTGARGLLVRNDDSLGERLRRRRWRLVRQPVSDLAELRVLDLDGTGDFWSKAPVQPAHVTVINLLEAHDLDAPCVTSIEGDALRADEILADEEFGLAFSNSLIEHLGGHTARRRSADVVAAMAPRHLVQTPYRHDPVEPHWMFPGFPSARISWERVAGVPKSMIAVR